MHSQFLGRMKKAVRQEVALREHVRAVARELAREEGEEDLVEAYLSAGEEFVVLYRPAMEAGLYDGTSMDDGTIKRVVRAKAIEKKVTLKIRRLNQRE